TFDIRFAPTQNGLLSAVVSINSNDGNENPFNFAITGVGAVPVIGVDGNSIPISDGDTSPSTVDDTNFGSLLISSGTVVHTFTIHNTGTAILNLTGVPLVQVSGASSFSLLTPPSTSVVPGGSTT